MEGSENRDSPQDWGPVLPNKGETHVTSHGSKSLTLGETGQEGAWEASCGDARLCTLSDATGHVQD